MPVSRKSGKSGAEADQRQDDLGEPRRESTEDVKSPSINNLESSPSVFEHGSAWVRADHIVARWTFKTAAVLNRASSYGNPSGALTHPVPDEYLRIVKSGAVPDDVIVIGSGCV